MAQGILNGAKALKTEDAEAYYLQLVLDKAMGHSRAEMEASFTKGLALNPDFTPIYSAKAEYLLPRWSGQPGDWESYASHAADRMGGDNGDILYMFIVRSVAYTEGPSLFDDSLLSYPRMKKGFLAACARYPGNTWDLNSFCYFASIAGDHDTAVDLFKRIGDNYVEDVWGSRNDFEYWKAKRFRRPGARLPGDQCPRDRGDRRSHHIVLLTLAVSTSSGRAAATRPRAEAALPERVLPRGYSPSALPHRHDDADEIVEGLEDTRANLVLELKEDLVL